MSYLVRKRLALVVAVALVAALALPSTGIGAVGAQAVFAPDAYDTATVSDDATANAKVMPAQSYHTFDSSTTVANTSGDVDWISWSVPATGPVTIWAIPTGGDNCTPRISVFPGSATATEGQLIATANWNWWAGSIFTSMTSVPGTYYARISESQGPGRDGAYNLYVSVGSARRLYGSNRYNTALAVSQDLYNSPGSGGTVILATGASYADALAAGALANWNGYPILLTDSKALTAGVGDEIRRIGAGTVVILGGTGAISTAVETAVKALPSVGLVSRLAGSDRYGTAVAIARDTTSTTSPLGQGLSSILATGGAPVGTTQTVPTIFVASGANFADALSVGPIASACNATYSVTATDGSAVWFTTRNVAPVVLVQPSALPSVTAQFISDAKPRKIFVCGGASAVATSVLTSMQSLVPSATITRVYGADRYETSYKLATLGRTSYGLDASSCVLVSGGASNWPDGLTASTFACWYWQPILLTNPTSLSAAVTQYYKDVDGWSRGNTVIGGPAAVSATAYNSFFNSWKGAIN